MAKRPVALPQPYLLTDDEHRAIRQAGTLWNTLCRTVQDGPSRDGDLAELRIHVHAIQHAIMAQAAARAYPSLYRPLGGTLQETSDHG